MYVCSACEAGWMNTEGRSKSKSLVDAPGFHAIDLQFIQPSICLYHDYCRDQCNWDSNKQYHDSAPGTFSTGRCDTSSRFHAFLPSGLYRNVKLTRFQLWSLPFALLTISCCHFHLLSPLMTNRLLLGIRTSSFRPVFPALPALPLLTEPSNGFVSS